MALLPPCSRKESKIGHGLSFFSSVSPFMAWAFCESKACSLATAASTGKCKAQNAFEVEKAVFIAGDVNGKGSCFLVTQGVWFRQCTP